MDLIPRVQNSMLQLRSSVLRHWSKYERDVLAFSGYPKSLPQTW